MAEAKKKKKESAGLSTESFQVPKDIKKEVEPELPEKEEPTEEIVKDQFPRVPKGFSPGRVVPNVPKGFSKA